METNANDKLAQLREQMRQAALIGGMEDLQVGDIVYYNMDREDGIVPNPPYDSRLKYVVVAGAKADSKEVCAVLINSANDFSAAQDWQAEQYLIRQVDYPAILDHDSWIDCTDPKELKVSKIMAKNTEKKGRLKACDLANVMKHLKESDFIDLHTKRVYGIENFTMEELEQ